jgi:predicted acetyltransferase
MPDIEVRLAHREEQPALANLMQLYIHDFSEQWVGTRRGELQDDGRFFNYPLDNYWDAADRVPLLIRRDGHLAGFALINSVPHSGRDADRNMAEFFIVRKHRRSGVGRIAAHEIFSRYAGLWEVAVARRNTPALAFWRRAIASHPGVREVEEFDMDAAAWNGSIIRLRSSA